MEQALHQAAILTFEELGFMFPTARLDETELSGENGAVTSVSFTGAVNGELVLQVGRAMLPIIAANMLGDDEPVDEEMQRDAFGEIANVICGNALPAIAGSQAVFRLGAPAFNSLSKKDVKPDATAYLELEEGFANILLYLDK